MADGSGDVIGGFGRRARAERRLVRLGEQVAERRRRAAELEEQVVFLAGVEADAEVDAVVGGDTISAREARAASSDAARARRELEEVRAAIARLLAEQDRLLEGL